MFVTALPHAWNKARQKKQLYALSSTWRHLKGWFIDLILAGRAFFVVRHLGWRLNLFREGGVSDGVQHWRPLACQGAETGEEELHLFAEDGWILMFQEPQRQCWSDADKSIYHSICLHLTFVEISSSKIRRNGSLSANYHSAAGEQTFSGECLLSFLYNCDQTVVRIQLVTNFFLVLGVFIILT